MHHVIFWAVLVAVGYGAGRVHQWARFVASAARFSAAVAAEAKKV
jgi:hypothetical protein